MICARSALQFFLDLYRDSALAPFVEEIETDYLDENVRAWGEREGFLSEPEIEPHIPRSHWWWWAPGSPPAVLSIAIAGRQARSPLLQIPGRPRNAAPAAPRASLPLLGVGCPPPPAALHRLGTLRKPAPAPLFRLAKPSDQQESLRAVIERQETAIASLSTPIIQV